MKRKIQLLYFTLLPLKPIQWLYQFRKIIRGRLGILYQEKPKENAPEPRLFPLTWKKKSLSNEPNFCFLNLKKEMSLEQVDWNSNDFGKLWTYNLNYFDFIHRMDTKEALLWMKNYARCATLKDGLEPYPTALRIMNWIWFILENEVEDKELHDFVFSDAYRLSKNIEYHILANHVLEDALAMCTAALFFDHDPWKKRFQKLALEQIDEQFQSDGAHYEQSPMYQMILLDRILDVCLLERSSGLDSEFFRSCRNVVKPILAFAEFIHVGKSLPRLNDASIGIAADLDIVLAKARTLGIEYSKLDQAGESGYRKFHNEDWTVVMDLAEVGPSFQPGHAHADTLSFELYDHNGLPLITDVGTSTYQPNERRQWERSTEAHNTVSYAGLNSSDVWGGFRTARRAKIIERSESGDSFQASHDGYRHLGVIHKRHFQFNKSEIVISDLIKEGKRESYSYLHFHPDVHVVSTQDEIILNDEYRINFKGFDSQHIESYDYATEFNKLAHSNKWVGCFGRQSTITIERIRSV
jgi:uncharacterized heparinase superfamily protein